MAYRPSAGRNQRTFTEPKMIDLVPIINLFVTIIPFLLLILVITQVALVALNFTQGTGGGEGSVAGGGSGAKRDIPIVEVIIMAPEDAGDKLYPGFEIREPGKAPVPLHLVNNQYDYVALDSLLKDIRSRYPNLYDINVAPYPYVRYETLIKTIDICKSNSFINAHYKAPQVMYFSKGV
ncbi:MAG TPA: hypothetical protein PLW62_01210 [Candidatus Cloacimonadota bacterium]|nr:hypothetical protein [Candidatus Cloacimonadota bacterium]